MKKILQGTMLGLSIMSMSAMAQAEDTRIGAGVSFSGTGTTVKVPIDLGTLRIEPELSFIHDSTGVGTTNFHIGSGVYLKNHVSNAVDLYFGGKALIIHHDLGVTDDTIFSIAAVAGFEYFLDKQVSLGGEALFGIGIGDETTVGIETAVVLRYYF